MNIDIQFYLNNTLTRIQEKVWGSLTDRQKQIGLIAAAAIGFLTACYLVYRFSSCCFNAKEVAKSIPEQKVEKKAAAPVVKREMEILKDEPQPDEQAADPGEEAEQLRDVLNDQPPLNDQSPLADDFVAKFQSEAFHEDEYRSEPTTPLIVPSLLALGEVRKNSTPGEPPSLEGITFSESRSVMENATAAFARCFHTSESHEEIYQLLRNIREKMDRDFDGTRLYVGDFEVLYNNLINLHNALPGEEGKKEIKIYWSKSVEEGLIPYLFEEHEEADVKKLLFAIIPGKPVESPLQAEKMNFNHQLQFIGFDFDLDMIKRLENEIERFSQEVLNVDRDVMEGPHLEFLKEALTEENFEKYMKDPLIGKAFYMTGMTNILLNLQDLQAKSKEFDLFTLPPEEINPFLKNLLNPPKDN